MKGTLSKIWALFLPSEKRRALLMLGLVTLMAAAETLGVLSIMPFLSVLARPGIVNEHPVLRTIYQNSGSESIRDFLVILGLATMVVVVISSALKTVTLHVVNRFVHFQRHSLSSRLLSRYLHQPYEFFLSRNPSELSKNILSEVDQLTFELLQPLSMLIAQGTIVLAVSLVVFIYDPMMAILIMLALGLLYGGIYLLARTRLARIGALRTAANTARYKSCNEALGGIKDVKVTGASSVYLGMFSRSSREFSRHSATAETLSQSPLYIVEAVGYSGLIMISLALLTRSQDIALVLPALGLYGFSAYRLLPAVQIMYRGFARLRFSTAVLDGVHHDLSLPARTEQTGGGPIVPQREIRLQNVWYAYPSAPDNPVLNDLTLVIPAKTIVGIVGKSGTGKSTIMDLILGLLHPQSGSVRVDDIDLTPKNTHQWQLSIGYVPQHIYLADTSVAENIAFGVPKQNIDMRAVERAARTAQIHDFIVNELPYGYLTPLGDRGTRLSGGQRQRVGIARALYRDPPVLLFDEATSALDRDTEEAVNRALKNVTGKKTIVIISHKETSLVHCHKVISTCR